MGISDILSSFNNAWYTISGKGQPTYRVDSNGAPISKSIMAQLATKTSQAYGISYQPNPYIEPEKPAIYA